MKYFKKEKLFIRVFNEIRTYIIENKLEPGDKLPTEQELCNKMGISRNALREAIKALEIMGIIESRPSIGIIIQDFNTDFIFQSMLYYLMADDTKLIHEILDVRKTLELGFIEQAYDKITDKELDDLEKVLESMKARVEKNQLFYNEDHQFHKILYRNLDNKTLNSILDAAWNINEEFNYELKKSYLDNDYTKHELLYKAIKNKDKKEFMKQFRKHFQNGYNQPNLK